MAFKVHVGGSGTSYPKPKASKFKNKKKDSMFVSRFDKLMQEGEPKKVWVRKRVKTPFPTNYLPTIPLKLSAIIRYYQFKKDIKLAERSQRKERDIEVSKYSILTSYLEKEIDKEREAYIKSRGKTPSILLFKIHPKFDGVLGRTIRYLSIQDDVSVITMNSNYDKITNNPPPRLLMVKIGGE